MTLDSQGLPTSFLIILEGEINMSETTMPIETTLNQVEGFDPRKYMRQLVNEDTGETTEYLDVQFRKLWFRLKYPMGKIAKRLVQFDAKVAVVEAKIYLDKDDAEGNFVSCAFAQRYLDDSRLGSKYVELAETAAVGRALADAGFGTQFCERDADIVDAGVPDGAAPAVPAQPAAPGAAAPAAGTSGAATAAPSTVPPPAATAAPGTAAPTTATTPPAAAGTPAAALAAGTATTPPAPAGLVTPPVPAYKSSTPVADILAVMTLEEAKAVVVDFKSGVLKDKTLAQIAFESPKDLSWFVTSYKGTNNILRAGAQKLLNAANEQKAS